GRERRRGADGSGTALSLMSRPLDDGFPRPLHRRFNSMFQRPFVGLTLAALGLVLAAGLGVGAWLYFQHKGNDAPPTNPGAPDRAGFRECAKESGIAFRMSFLPDEQGEKFKINLYDHGCGLAV